MSMRTPDALSDCKVGSGAGRATIKPPSRHELHSSAQHLHNGSHVKNSDAGSWIILICRCGTAGIGTCNVNAGRRASSEQHSAYHVPLCDQLPSTPFAALASELLLPLEPWQPLPLVLGPRPLPQQQPGTLAHALLQRPLPSREGLPCASALRPPRGRHGGLSAQPLSLRQWEAWHDRPQVRHSSRVQLLLDALEIRDS